MIYWQLSTVDDTVKDGVPNTASASNLLESIQNGNFNIDSSYVHA